MKPDIFMDDFDRSERADSIYSVIGRALTLATHFESSCRGLVVVLKLRTTPREILDFPEGFEELSDELYRRSLYQNISTFAPTQDDFRQLLDKARNARNEIVHEIALGFEDWEKLKREEDFFLSRIHELSLILAEADRAVCFALTVLTHDQMPNNDFLEKYPERIAKWVCDLE